MYILQNFHTRAGPRGHRRAAAQSSLDPLPCRRVRPVAANTTLAASASYSEDASYSHRHLVPASTDRRSALASRLPRTEGANRVVRYMPPSSPKARTETRFATRGGSRTRVGRKAKLGTRSARDGQTDRQAPLT